MSTLNRALFPVIAPQIRYIFEGRGVTMHKLLYGRTHKEEGWHNYSLMPPANPEYSSRNHSAALIINIDLHVQ
jgi:hypothetical protein